MTCSLERWAARSREELKCVGVAVCGVHLGEEVIEDSKSAKRIECACVPEWVLERNVTPRCGGMIRPLVERFVFVIIV